MSSSSSDECSPVFFEVSWSILSTICITNVMFGFLVCGITSFTPLAAVPIITSAAGALANGLCYYTYYESHSRSSRAATSVFGDVLWLIQEAGLTMYSYIILRHVLSGTRRRVFVALFWALMLLLAATRVFIVIFRVQFILNDDETHRITVNYLHIGYFGFMAVLECVSAYFLITILTSVKASSLQAALKVGLFRYLTRSTEVRVAILAVQGVFRTFTHSFQTPGQQAKNVASQLDRFAYALLCLFPIVLYIDLLASKLVNVDHIHATSSLSGAAVRTRSTAYVSTTVNVDSKRVDHKFFGPRRPSSQEHIFDDGISPTGNSGVDLDELDSRGNVIHRRGDS